MRVECFGVGISIRWSANCDDFSYLRSFLARSGFELVKMTLDTGTKDVYHDGEGEHEVLPTRDWSPAEEKKAKRKYVPIPKLPYIYTRAILIKIPAD